MDEKSSSTSSELIIRELTLEPGRYLIFFKIQIMVLKLLWIDLYKFTFCNFYTNNMNMLTLCFINLFRFKTMNKKKGNI